MSKVLTPGDVADAAQKCEHIPQAIISVVNNLLIEKYNDGQTIVLTQDEIIAKILESQEGVMTRQQIFNDRLLDFEPIFRQHGWIVEYVKSQYGENFTSFFRFSVKG